MKLRNQPRRLVIISAVTGALVIGVAGFAAASAGGGHHVEVETPEVHSTDVTGSADDNGTDTSVETETESSEIEHGTEVESENEVEHGTEIENETESHDAPGVHEAGDDNGIDAGATGSTVDDSNGGDSGKGGSNSGGGNSGKGGNSGGSDSGIDG